MHISESQQEFFRMLDEKIEKVRHNKGNVHFHSGGGHTGFLAPWRAQPDIVAALHVLQYLEGLWSEIPFTAHWLDSSSAKKNKKVKRLQEILERILCFVETSPV